LAGPIPPGVGLLAALVELLLCCQQMNGTWINISAAMVPSHNDSLKGTYPAELENLKNLNIIDVSQNAFAYGTWIIEIRKMQKHM
jgi:hypothetical protein